MRNYRSLEALQNEPFEEDTVFDDSPPTWNPAGAAQWLLQREERRLARFPVVQTLRPPQPAPPAPAPPAPVRIEPRVRPARPTPPPPPPPDEVVPYDNPRRPRALVLRSALSSKSVRPVKPRRRRTRLLLLVLVLVAGVFAIQAGPVIEIGSDPVRAALATRPTDGKTEETKTDETDREKTKTEKTKPEKAKTEVVANAPAKIEPVKIAAGTPIQRARPLPIQAAFHPRPTAPKVRPQPARPAPPKRTTEARMLFGSSDL